MHSDPQFTRRIVPEDQSPPIGSRDPSAPGDAALIATAQDAIIVRDLRDRVVFWNRGAQRLYGWSRREAAGLTSVELLHSRFPTTSGPAFAAIRDQGEWEGLVYHKTRDHREVAVWTRWTAVRDTDGSVVSVVQADRDITWLTDVVESAADAIVVIDQQRRIVLFNAAAADVFGISSTDALNEPIDRFLPDSLSDELAASGAESVALEHAGAQRAFRKFAARRADGTLLALDASIARVQAGGRALTAIIFHRTSRNQLVEENFRHAQSMQTIGRLAGGIAYDFNNLLSAITGYLEFVRPAVADPVALADLDEVTSAAYRAADLARQLLVFTRSQVTRPRLVRPNAIIESTGELLGRVVSAGVRVETRLDPDVPSVRVDPAQLEHALLSLAINADDAMPNGGTLTVATTLADAFGARGERRAVMIEVSDTGMGMDDATRRRAFEPFFTTKTDAGAGLGLAAVHGVATQAGGSVSITSAPGRGTRVSITLPVPDDASSPSETDASRSVAPKANGRRVLLVEDDDAVRRLAARLLQREGHAVIEARTGELALERWREATRAGAKINIVVTDIVMPDMGGRELIARLRATEPRLPVVYLSAYLAGAVSGLDLAGPTDLLEKPFSAASLNAAVEAVLAPDDKSRR